MFLSSKINSIIHLFFRVGFYFELFFNTVLSKNTNMPEGGVREMFPCYPHFIGSCYPQMICRGFDWDKFDPSFIDVCFFCSLLILGLTFSQYNTNHWLKLNPYMQKSFKNS